MGAGDLVFRGVVGALGIVTAGSLVWFSATGVGFEFGSNTRTRSRSHVSTPSFAPSFDSFVRFQVRIVGQANANLKQQHGTGTDTGTGTRDGPSGR